MSTRDTIEVLLSITVAAALTAACTTVDGNPTAAQSAASSEATTTSPAPAPTTSTEVAAPAPAGPPIGTATMQVSGGPGPVTISYQINGEAEQTETNVTLPWERQYPVYNEVQSSVTADGGDAELMCSIIMDGNLVAFKTEPRPTCSFAYYS